MRIRAPRDAALLLLMLVRVAGNAKAEDRPLRRCGTPWEPLVQELVAFMFTKGFIHQGSVVTAGAHLGEEACHFAELDKNRTVHALEPMVANHACIKQFASTRPNIALTLGGLGSKPGRVKLGDIGRKGGDHLSSGGTMAIGLQNLVDTGVSADDNAPSFPVFTIDKLFGNGLFAGESLAFLHLDIEGSELPALMGATKVIKRDRPVIVSETNITDKSYAPQLAMLHQFGYRVLMVHEVCGSLS